MPINAQPLWFSGVCDQMLDRVRKWYLGYDAGEVYATRPFLHQDARVEDVPTIRLVKVAWKKEELNHLVRILEQVEPEWLMTRDMRWVRDNLHRCRLLVNDLFLTELAFYKPEVKKLLATLERVKTGAASLDQVAEQKQKEGKGLWE